MPGLHFVGFRDERYWPKDERYQRAVALFGQPDFLHRRWDVRAAQEVAPGDVVVFAVGDEHEPPSEQAFDDSAHDIVFHGGRGMTGL